MYGDRISGTSHPGGKVTHLREWDGRKIHVVDWTKEQIDNFNAEQDIIREKYNEANR